MYPGIKLYPTTILRRSLWADALDAIVAVDSEHFPAGVIEAMKRVAAEAGACRDYLPQKAMCQSCPRR